ncbi:disks large homolog 5-like isoform X2 [Alosa sapidissima]|uniref:disks large homolog 5-like isoform X2 n=1 Tax=Alosa sapidissima TaxID=34773 RepID=UPI001C09DF08|nr:disks large homolog 5-like isoform X2 [Alosa sapidissima]
MEPKHKELLDQYHQNLLESITDAERVVEFLVKTGTLTQVERFELENNCSSSSEKVDLLLKMLMSKERDHFQDLCLALEKTHPHLYSTLVVNGGGSMDHSGSTYSVLSTMPSDSESSSSLSSIASSPPPPALQEQRPPGERLEAVLFQLRQVTRQRDELRKRLALASPGTTFDECRPSAKPGHDYERLKLQCTKAMGDLQSLQNQHSKTLQRCEEAVKEADFYHTLHSRALGEQAQLKEEAEGLRRDYSQLLREHQHLQQACDELRRLRLDDQREAADLRMLHQQVIRENGSPDILNKLYDTAMDKLETARKEYEALRKRYNEKTANHNADLSRLEQVEEENRRLQKQVDVLLKHRDSAVHYQQQCSAGMRRLDALQQELAAAASRGAELQRELERVQSEATRSRTLQLKAGQEAEKLREERDAVLSEYRLVMSERDQVIKEVDKLQTGLEAAEAKLKNTSSQRRVASEELEALRQELGSALVERDRALCERNELLEKYCFEVKDKAEAQKELSQACRDMEAVKEERDVARKERTEAIIQRDQLLREYYQARQKQDSAALDMERANKELEILRKQCEAMSQELQEASQEAEVAKCRRDWAFQERDKIVAERESIRTLCDNLRRERDRAVSDLADALRNLDDTRKQKNDAVRELKELKEKMEDQLEKEARFRQLMAHNSHDSAIDTDSLEWETEVVEFEKDRDDMDLKALGFDIAEGVNDPYLPGDCGIFVTKVDKGSVADGRLRVNDWLLKINDVDLANKDRKQVIKAVLSGGGVINMVVRRRKSLGGRIITPIHLNLAGHKDSGIGLESGVFVASVAPGSPAAKDGSLTIGDRLIAINGIALDNRSLSECESLLRDCRDSLSLSLLKFFPQSLSGQSLFEVARELDKSPSGKLPGAEVLARNCRNLRHNSSTQTDIYSPESPASAEPSPPPYQDVVCYQRHLTASPHQSKRPLTFHPASVSAATAATAAECVSVAVDMPPEKSHTPQRSSGGTWPRVLAGGPPPSSSSSPDAAAPLSIFRVTAKRRKPIFDADIFKRPDTPTKLDYVTLSKARPQSPRTDAPANPPTPPTRSDSFKYKHKQQSSSASDSTLTTGSPPSTPSQCPPPSAPGGQLGGELRTREDVAVRTGPEQEMKRPRPSSAPAPRRQLTPLKIPIPMQAYAKDERSPDSLGPVDFSPTPPHAHMGFPPPGYHGPLPGQPSPRGLSPCPAVTTVMHNPVYTAWSHWVNSNTCPPAPHSRNSPQHHGRLSLDLSHKRSSELSDGARRTPHSTNSLPSSARHGGVSSQYRAERIKIPSTPRYMRSAQGSTQGSDRGSLSHSDCSTTSLITPPLSPLNLETTSFVSSQSQGSISSHVRLSVSPAPMGDRRNDRRLLCNKSFPRLPRPLRPKFASLRSLRPYLEEPRAVTIHKGAEPLGISIVGGENGGIFVSKVTGGSIAHQYQLEFGDQLLEFNGINLRNATEQQARLIIGQQCDTVTILAQYNPHMYQLGNHSRSSSRIDPISSHPPSHGSGATPPDDHSTIDTLSEQDEGTMTPPSKQTTPTTSPRGSVRRVLPEPRRVTVQRVLGELGVSICGGNLHGIYVERLEEDSPARAADGLMPGDLILEYSSVSLQGRTAEEAYLEMLKPLDTVTLRVQHRLEEFNMLRDSPGDGFYIRALYDRMAEVDEDLSFKKDDILYVDDTLPKGNFGYWMAWQLDENAQRLGRGQIPSKYMLEQELQRRLSVPDGKEEACSSRSLSAAARRSFFRRKNRHKRSTSREGKDTPAPDAISTDSIPYMEDCVNVAYQRVQKVECISPRPVLLLGPLVEATKDMLVKQADCKFCRCPLEVMKASQQAIERGVKDCLFIDYKRRSGHFDVTTVASIKEVTEKQDCHCLLDIAPHAIERLHSVHIYPIVIFIRYKNAKQIKEQKDPVYLRDKVSQKHSKEQFEVAQKTEQEYSKYFTGVVQAGSLAYICTQIETIVDQEQSKVLWIPD